MIAPDLARTWLGRTTPWMVLFSLLLNLAAPLNVAAAPDVPVTGRAPAASSPDGGCNSAARSAGRPGRGQADVGPTHPGQPDGRADRSDQQHRLCKSCSCRKPAANI